MILPYLNVLTPFKGNSSFDLNFTIAELVKSSEFAKINHIIIMSSESFGCIKSSFKRLNTERYRQILLEYNTQGIYSAINYALALLDPTHWYTCLGAGDALFLAHQISYPENCNCIRIPYCLSSNPKVFFTSLRPIWSGMPYCHNALLFKVGDLRYDQNYYISADYKFYLQYLHGVHDGSYSEITYLSDCGYVLFDDVAGISSRRKYRKNIQNLAILWNLGKKFRFFVFLYILRSLLKLPLLVFVQLIR